jgi:hypothetical protein
MNLGLVKPKSPKEMGAMDDELKKVRLKVRDNG